MAETRQSLIEAARHEFALHGLDKPSLDSICERAGFTRGAFYVHFRSRRELIAVVVTEPFQSVLVEIAAGPTLAHAAETARRTVAEWNASSPGQDGPLPIALFLEAARRDREVCDSIALSIREVIESLDAMARANGQSVAERNGGSVGSLIGATGLGAAVMVSLGVPLDSMRLFTLLDTLLAAN